MANACPMQEWNGGVGRFGASCDDDSQLRIGDMQRHDTWSGECAAFSARLLAVLDWHSARIGVSRRPGANQCGASGVRSMNNEGHDQRVANVMRLGSR